MSATPTPLRVLIVEDNRDDADLVVRELRRSGLAIEWRCVETEAEYRAAIALGVDLILSDFRLPSFGGLRALEIVGELKLDVPFILVSGTIGEEIAVSAMQLGASDYLLKDRLVRLGPAVNRALDRSRSLREAHRADAALRMSEERFLQLAETIGEVFWITDDAVGGLVYISPAYERIWGRTCASVLADPLAWPTAVHPLDLERVQGAWAERQSSGHYDETFRIVRADGTTRWIRDRAYPMKENDAASRRTVGVAEDISEHKDLEARFLRAQRMEAIGTLAGGLAHDLNNILAPVLLATGLLKDRTSASDDHAMLDMMEKSAKRGAGIVRQLLTFSRGVGGERAAVQLRHVLAEIANIVRETFPREISLWHDTEAALWPIIADATQIHQVFINLCVNARDAMPEGGTLSIEARNVVLGPEDAARWPEAKSGTYVRITVTDSGTGMSHEVLPKIFDPFFTTKDIGKGTGLGLSTVAGIVRSHAGFLDVQSELAKGTAFKVYLPASPRLAQEPEEIVTRASRLGNGETILVVDDEESIREATERLLISQNFKVLTAANGQEAVVLYLEHHDRISLVFTDVMMPAMGGVALIRALQVMDPAVRCIAITGMETRTRRAELAALGITQLLRKPCGPAELLNAIDRALFRRDEPAPTEPTDWR